MDLTTDTFTSNLIDFWRKWHNGEALGDSAEWIHLAELSKTAPIEAFGLVSAIARQDKEGVTFHCLSDCVTDMLRFHGATIITHLESEAASSARFATMLSYVTPDHVPDDLRGRLSRISVADTKARGDVRIVVAGAGRVVIGLDRHRSFFAVARDAISSMVDRIREWFPL